MTQIRSRPARPLDRPAASARFGPALDPVVVDRVALFEPVKKGRPSARARARVLATPWGRVRVVGQLTQTHRQALAALWAVAEFREPAQDGSGDPALRLVADPARVVRLMRARDPGAGPTWDYRWLTRLLGELVSVRVELEDGTTTGPHKIMGMVAAVGRYRREIQLSPGRLSHRGHGVRTRALIYVTLSSAWLELWRVYHATHYAQYLPALGRLKPVSAAIAVLAFSQASGWRISLDHALRAVGAWDDRPTTAGRKGRSRARLEVQHDSAALAALGVQVDLAQGQIQYQRPAGVYVSPP